MSVIRQVTAEDCTHADVTGGGQAVVVVVVALVVEAAAIVRVANAYANCRGGGTGAAFQIPLTSDRCE